MIHNRLCKQANNLEANERKCPEKTSNIGKSNAFIKKEIANKTGKYQNLNVN